MRVLGRPVAMLALTSLTGFTGFTGFTSALGAMTVETTRLAVGEALAILGAVTLVGLLAAAVAWAWHERRIDEGLQPS